MSKFVILTGAGISAESGLGTFRDQDGLWAQHRIEDVATPEGFARNPGLVQEFYNARRAQAAAARPNAAHEALARLESENAGEVLIITQNVDGLHEAAGSRNVVHMHGQLDRALCHACGHRWPAPKVMQPEDTCPECGQGRPDRTWCGSVRYPTGWSGSTLRWPMPISLRQSGHRAMCIRRRPLANMRAGWVRIRWN